MPPQEIPLEGGCSAEEVVRIGNVVHRSRGERYLFVRKLLLHLEARGFPYSPRYLGEDEAQRMMLSYIPGEVPRGLVLSETQLIQAAQILRQLHDASVGFPALSGEQVICHRDFAPWNIIIHEGKVSGVIDFDEAEAGLRIDDFAYFIWTFLELGDPAISLEQQLKRIRLLAKAYGQIESQLLSIALLGQQERILQFRSELVLQQNNPEDKRAAENRVNRIELEMAWVAHNRKEIDNCLG